MVSSVRAYERPPLPTVERYHLTDSELFEKLDETQPAMKAILDIYHREGTEAGKAALATYFRQRQKPYWRVNPHTRTSEEHSISESEKQHADNALEHLFDQRHPHHQFQQNIDWLDNPTYAEEYEFDKEWSMSFLRMPWWTSLGRAYWATGDETYAREIVDQFLSFRRAHPIPKKRHGSLRNHPLKYVVPEWRTLETSIRIRGSWSESFFRLLTSPSFTDQALTEMLKSFWEMANYLHQFTRVKGRTNNWTTSELLALHTAAALFPEFQASTEWRNYAIEYMWREFEKQVYPDGVQWELAPGYGMGVTKQFRALIDTARMAGDALPEPYLKRLEGMYHYFLYSSVAGRCPAFGDSGHGAIHSLMQLAARDFPERHDFVWAASHGKQGNEPQELTSSWPWAGQYAMRSGWKTQDRFMVVDAGPYGVSHQNEDNLSYELYAYGDWLICDPGSYRYNYDSPWRRFMTGSLSHNTLIVDHQGQNRRSQRELWTADKPQSHRFESSNDYVYFRGSYSSGYGDRREISVTHTRSIFFVDGRFWVILDRALPGDQEQHLYETLMMLNAEQAEVTANQIVTQREEGPNIAIVAAPQPEQTVAVTEGQMDPVTRGWKKGGKTVVPNPTATVGIRTAGPACMALLLYPIHSGKTAPDDIHIEFVYTDNPHDVKGVRVTVPNKPPFILADRLGEDGVTFLGKEMPGQHALWQE